MQLLANMAAHMYTPFAHAICIRNNHKNILRFFRQVTLCIFYPMTPFAHAFAYAIKKTPFAFFAKITLCMYILCGQMLKKETGYR